MRVRTQWGARNARLTYKVRGDSLDKANVQLLARDEVGRFHWSLGYKFYSDATQTVTSVVLSPKSQIEMPTWPQYQSQPRPCQDSWDSMWKALHKHEKGHARIFESALLTIANELEEQQRMRSGGTESYMRRRLAALKKQQDKYDTETDHGRSRGVTLVITQACRSKP